MLQYIEFKSCKRSFFIGYIIFLEADRLEEQTENNVLFNRFKSNDMRTPEIIQFILISI